MRGFLLDVTVEKSTTANTRITMYWADSRAPLASRPVEPGRVGASGRRTFRQAPYAFLSSSTTSRPTRSPTRPLDLRASLFLSLSHV